MRWFVEISPLGTKGGQDAILCVEAPQWQPALQKARALRGDNGALSNFSIELLEEGYRAIDPSTRLRYIVRRAPDDAQVTHSGLSEAPPPVSMGETPKPPAQPVTTGEPARSSSAPAAPDPPKKRPPTPTVEYSSKGAASVNPPEAAPVKPAEPAAANPAATAPAPAAEVKKRPLAQTMAFASSGNAHVDADAQAAAPLPEPPRPAAAAVSTPAVAAKAAPVAAAAAATAAPARAAEALPSFVVIGSREDNPTDSSPLTYREYVYAVAPGTPEEDARRLIFERFEHVRGTLDPTRTGRLVNLAVFDHIFHGRPQRRPVVTLAWKDWKAEDPEVRYPQRDAPPSAAPSAPAAKPTVDPPASPKAAAPAPVVVKAPAPVVVKAPVPVVVKAPAAGSATLSSAKPVVLPKLEPDSQVPIVEAAPVAAKAAPAATTPVQPAPAAKAVSPAAPFTKAGAPAETAPETRPVPTTVTPGGAAPAAAVVGAPVVAVAAAPVVAAPAAAVVAAPVVATPAAAVAAAPVVAAPVAASAAAPAAAAPVATVAAAPVVPGPAAVPKPAAAPAPPAAAAARPRAVATGQGADAPKKRLTGDDLLAELFEAFGDLHFARDSLEGAEFVLHLTLEKLPSEVGLISLFDMNKREFVVVRQVGGPRSALCARQPEKADLAFAAMRKRHALVISDAEGAARAMDDRWRAIGVQLKSLVCTPVELSGRYLGLIELANPTDGQAFNEGDGNALTYIGQQFAEFVAGKGVIVDPAQIREEPAPPAPAAPPAPTSSPRSSAGKKGR